MTPLAADRVCSVGISLEFPGVPQHPPRQQIRKRFAGIVHPIRRGV